MDIKKMNDLRLLNVDYIREILIRYDWTKLTKGLNTLIGGRKVYRFPEVMLALQREYRVTKTELQNILFGKSEGNECFCKSCGVRISKAIYDINDGLCTDCYAEKITID